MCYGDWINLIHPGGQECKKMSDEWIQFWILDYEFWIKGRKETSWLIDFLTSQLKSWGNEGMREWGNEGAKMRGCESAI